MNPAISQISPRQHQILEHLMENRNGLCVDDLAKRLGISRTGVQQHFVALERDGYIKKSTLNKTAGRPVTIYVITDQGINYFPKQYAWFAQLIISDMLEDVSPDRFKAYMQKLGNKLAEKLRVQFEGKSLPERVNQLGQVMTDLGFQVKADIDETGKVEIQACNCIYHDLAQEHHEICDFDLALMSSLLDRDVEQISCMAEGDCNCRFTVK